MYAHLGGDEKERQLLALLATLNVKDSRNIPVMVPGSQIVLLTDSPSHNESLIENVTKQAIAQKVCINVFLSATTWPEYWRIANETGGTVVHSIDQTSISQFNHTHSVNQCADHYGLKYGRQKRSARSSDGIAEKCKYFNASLFTTEVLVTVNTNKDLVRVIKPDGNEILIFSNPRGEKIFHESTPNSGQYSFCVDNGTLTITVVKTENMNTIVKYLYRMENSTEAFLRYAPHPACKF